MTWLSQQEDPLAVLAERLQDDADLLHRQARECRCWARELDIANPETMQFWQLRPLVLEAAALRFPAAAVQLASARALPAPAPRQPLDAAAPAPVPTGTLQPPSEWITDITGRNTPEGFFWCVKGIYCRCPFWPGPQEP